MAWNSMITLLSLLIYTFVTLTYHICCEGRKEAEHAGDARLITITALRNQIDMKQSNFGRGVFLFSAYAYFVTRLLGSRVYSGRA